ncbi:hypothetical protein ACIGW4_01230 [Streptomyces sp. NPDC053513]|uniref:hypothetical protein n=1 Tax=unclassified Streptomyces TaxID=2593676 RepID=UPI0037D7ECD2
MTTQRRREPGDVAGQRAQRDGDAPGPAGCGVRRPHSPAAEVTAGIARLEGYLLVQRARTEAAEAGAAFARRFAWLGPHEQAEIARAFEREYLSVRRRMLRATVARADELRDEYSRRYAFLRRRLVAAVLGLTAAASVVLAVAARGTG